ncbi:MAG: GNAT family N-acetyltransferase [Firmicutes bacterium]|nr:GNAT family N-acetyltransferase [Bacillota bacterium]
MQLAINKGTVSVEGPVSRTRLEAMAIDDGLGNFRSPRRQKEALMDIADLPEGLVYIAQIDEKIVGYVLFHYPGEFSRWIRHPRLLELGAIEVSHNWQNRGLAKALLAEAFKNHSLEEFIVITTEFHWHWDLKGSGLNVWQYRDMLKKLFSSVGFKRRHTDDPEILEHQANMLMVRVGNNVSKSHADMFTDLTYQNSILR